MKFNQSPPLALVHRISPLILTLIIANFNNNLTGHSVSRIDTLSVFSVFIDFSSQNRELDVYLI